MAEPLPSTPPAAGRPVLSFVMPSRNDDHGGGLLDRMKTAVHGVLLQARRHRLPSELILVEWNPPPDRPPLREALGRLPDGPCAVRFLRVPPALHRRFAHADRVPLHVMGALNVGIRRARGEFVLTSNIDLLYSDPLFRFFASGQLARDALYRIDRTDVDREVTRVASLDDQLAYCAAHIVGVAGPRKHAFPPRGGVPQLHLGAPGDFLLMPRELWHTLRGFREEDITSLAADYLLCYAANRLGVREVILRPPLCLYHIDHGFTTGRMKLPLPPSLHAGLRRAKDRLPVAVRRRIAATLYGHFIKRYRYAAAGVPCLTYFDLERMILELYSGKRHFVFNDACWGFDGQDLEEFPP